MKNILGGLRRRSAGPDAGMSQAEEDEAFLRLVEEQEARAAAALQSPKAETAATAVAERQEPVKMERTTMAEHSNTHSLEGAEQIIDALRPINMTIVSPSMTMRDVEFESEEDLLVQGRVHGKVRVRQLTVVKGATVEGDITADSARVYGTLSGTCTIGTLAVAEGATLTGTMSGDRIGIQPGAKVKASMDFEQTAAIAASPASPRLGETAGTPVDSSKILRFQSPGGERLAI